MVHFRHQEWRRVTNMCHRAKFFSLLCHHTKLFNFLNSDSKVRQHVRILDEQSMNNQNAVYVETNWETFTLFCLVFFTLRLFRLLDHYPLWFEVKWPSIFQSQHSLFPWKPAINLQMGVPLLLNQCFLVNCAQIKWEPFSPPPHSTRDIKLLVLCVCYFEVNLVSSNSPLSQQAEKVWLWS